MSGDSDATVEYDPVDLRLVAEGLHETGRWKYARPALQRVMGEMSRLRKENAALREAGDAMGKRLHDWWHPCSGQILAEAKVPCENCDAIEVWRGLSAAAEDTP